jgi:acetyl-CoA synthetase
MTQPVTGSVCETILKKNGATGAQTPYETLLKDFSWDKMAEELKLPRQNGMNKASICLDDHPPEVMQRKALLWLGKNGEREDYTFQQLSEKTNQFANVLKSLGVQKGDRVFVYLERVPEVFVVLFGALKVGAVVGPLFSAFGPEAIQDRLEDSAAKVVVTSMDLKPRLDQIRSLLL